MRYFPLDTDTHSMMVGARPLAGLPLIEVDRPLYAEEIALKRSILAEDRRYYAQALPGSEAAQWEALALVLRDMAAHDPASFALEEQGERWTWRNRLLGVEERFTYGDASSMPILPIDWAGGQVQEDLIVLGPQPGAPLIAGQLCFGNGWCLDDKIGVPLLAIHDPVPGYAERVGRPTDLLMERLKPDRPVWRLNWSVKASPQLDAATRHAEALAALKQGITPANAGDRCWFRVERQGLAKLPATGAVLFTIHTYQQPVAELAQDPERARRLLGVLRTAPPDLLAYKGMAPFTEALIGYLEQTRG